MINISNFSMSKEFADAKNIGEQARILFRLHIEAKNDVEKKEVALLVESFTDTHPNPEFFKAFFVHNTTDYNSQENIKARADLYKFARTPDELLQAEEAGNVDGKIAYAAHNKRTNML